jgi:hypothetical protein
MVVACTTGVFEATKTILLPSGTGELLGDLV